MPLSLHKSVRSVPIALALAIGIPFPNAAANDQVPKVRVESVRRIFHNGEHNAFTDLSRFKGRYYLAFRSCPDGHGVHPTSSIIVLASGDTKSWQQVHRFHVPRRDTRDPHFLIFKGKLFVYTGTWYCGKSAPKRRDMNEHLGYAVWTVDGRKWQGPTMLEGTYGHYVWRAATFGSKAYLCARRKRGFARTRTRAERDRLVESAMLESDDGLVWKKVCLFQERYGDETAFQFDKDGQVLAIARSGGGRNAQICRSKPPYVKWTRKNLDRTIGGPLLAKWGNRRLVGGRQMVKGKAVTSLYWLVKDRLHEFARLPSGGDTSYPGFLDLGPKRAIVSYYSSHERDSHGKTMTAIYLARLVVADSAPEKSSNEKVSAFPAVIVSSPPITTRATTTPHSSWRPLTGMSRSPKSTQPARMTCAICCGIRE